MRYRFSFCFRRHTQIHLVCLRLFSFACRSLTCTRLERKVPSCWRTSRPKPFCVCSPLMACTPPCCTLEVQRTAAFAPYLYRNAANPRGPSGATQGPHMGHTWATHGPQGKTCKIAQSRIRGSRVIFLYKKMLLLEGAIVRFYTFFHVAHVWPMCGPCVAHVWPMCGP